MVEVLGVQALEVLGEAINQLPLKNKL